MKIIAGNNYQRVTFKTISVKGKFSTLENKRENCLF